MIGVAIAADDGDKKMWETLPRLLSKGFPMGEAEEDGVSGFPKDRPRLTICEAGCGTPRQWEAAILVFKDVVSLPAGFSGELPSVAVVDSSNKELVELVSLTKLPAITCGLSSRDTLTLTSIKEDSAVLGLQRSLTCFDGMVEDPQEIPLRLDGPMDSFTLMAAASVYLLTGRADLLRTVNFSSGRAK